MSQPVASGKVVGIYYTLKGPNGQVIDTNRKGGKPLAYLHGKGTLLPSVEKGLEGKVKNDYVHLSLTAEQGYGVRREDLIRKLDRSLFQAGQELAPGMRMNRRMPDGRVLGTVILAVDETQVTVDENHPLAGVPLEFEITICGVRDATAEELEHGHAHGAGGHHH
jgi:FKBP-type peptidyl-prolyl cis-trans isomerase SlyD